MDEFVRKLERRWGRVFAGMAISWPGEPHIAWGLVAGGQNLILAVAIVLGGYIVSNYSFNVLFIAMGTVQVIAAIYLVPILRSSP